MAGIYAHYICAQAAADAANRPELKDSPAYAVGSQGPDLLYYYNIIPFRKPKGMHGLGTRLHDTNTGALLKSMANYVQNAGSGALKEYFYGFITHYFLDAASHKYVKSRTESSRLHVLLETYLDAQLLSRTTGIRKCWQFLEASDPETDEIARMLSTAVLEAHGIDVGAHVFAVCMKTMPWVQKMLADPLGIKLAIAKACDFFAGKGAVTRFILPRKVERDYMNLSKAAWELPDGRTNQSFVELIDEAAFDSEKAILKFEDAFDSNSAPEAATSLGNISMATGYDCAEPVKWVIKPVFQGE